MKRSQAIELLRDLLDQGLNDKTGEINYGYMIDGLEKAGFLPPGYYPEEQYHETNGQQLENKPVRKYERE